MPGLLSAAMAGLLLAWAYPAMAHFYAGGDGPVACHDFRRGANRTGTVLHATTIEPEGVQINLSPGQTFAKNQSVDGIEVTTVLDRNCGNM